MELSQQSALMKEIEEAKVDEDRAWALAAEARRKVTKDAALMGAIQLVEATTSNRMRLEQELRDARAK